MEYRVTPWDASLLTAREEPTELGATPLAPPSHITSDSSLEAAVEVAKRSPYSGADPILYGVAGPGGLPGEFFEHPALLVAYQVETLG